jgi:hypothetical protein
VLAQVVVVSECEKRRWEGEGEREGERERGAHFFIHSPWQKRDEVREMVEGAREREREREN